MFREMRRKKQALDRETCIEILDRGTFGVLALYGDDGFPYAVPLGYHYEDGAIYFHCAKKGHKIDAIERDARASFCVVGQADVVPREYNTHFRSVIVFGSISKIESDDEKYETVRKLALKYDPDDTEENREHYIQMDFPPLLMLRLDIEHMTGKESLDLTNERLAKEREEESK